MASHDRSRLPATRTGCRAPFRKVATCFKAFCKELGSLFRTGAKDRVLGLEIRAPVRLQAISMYTGFRAVRAMRIASSMRKAAVEASRITTAWAVISLYTD